MQSATVREKAKQSVVQRYGVEFVSQSSEVQATKRTNCQKRYGTNHHTQTLGGLRKVQSYRIKHLVIGRTTYAFQGYEGHVIQSLVAKGFKVTTDVAPIKYTVGKTLHYYFPDLLAIKEGVTSVLEVKSPYTLGLAYWRKFRRNRRKFKAAESVYSRFFLVIIANGRGLFISNPSQYSLKELRRLLREKNIPGK